MKVEEILAGKGREVVTMPLDRTVAAAVAALHQRRIGAVVVTTNGRVVGIVSERDIVRALAEKGDAALDATLGACMTADPKTCTLLTGVEELMETMTVGRVRHVPVVEGGDLVGIVSIGDVVKHRLAEIEFEHAAMKTYITA